MRFLSPIIFLWMFVSLASAQVYPVKSGAVYRLEFAGILFESDTTEGGRISSFKLGSTQILSTNKADDYSWGSTFWPSPQNAWSWSQWGTWPPPAQTETGSYTGWIIQDTIVSLLSPVDNQAMIQVRKAFYASLYDSSVTITYTLINKSPSTRCFAPWENTRVPVGGLSFFPAGEGSLSGDAILTNSFKLMNDNIWWYKYQSAHSGKKMFGDGREGWRAHVNNGVLFLKQIPNIEKASAAPGENEIEEYVASGFHELENQGAYISLQPNDSLCYTVKWFARELPDGIVSSAGNRSLLRFARSILGLSSPVNIEAGMAQYETLRILPNPFREKILCIGIKSDTQLHIADLSGKIVFKEVLQHDQQLDLSHLSPGIYLYNFTWGDQHIHGKILKTQ